MVFTNLVSVGKGIREGMGAGNRAGYGMLGRGDFNNNNNNKEDF